MPRPAPPTHEAESGPSQTPGEPLVHLSEVDLKWQELASMEQHSPDFIPLLSSLNAGAGRLFTMKLQDESAKTALDALDKVNYPFVASGKRLSGDVY